MHLNGENCQNVIEGKNFMEMGKWTEYYFMILKKRTTGAGLPPPRGNIHVYYHNIQVIPSVILKVLNLF